MKINRPYIVDVEASGFGSRSYPIEIGLALEADTRYCSLILPSRDWTHWDRAAEKTHGITRSILATHGAPMVKVALDLNCLLSGGTVYTDGWAVDKPWITRLFAEAGVRQAFKVSSLERLLTEPQMEIWHTTKKQVIESLDQTRHRASVDAFIVQETFIGTKVKTART